VRISDSKPVALVTGASSGIGRAAAVHLAAAGFDVAVNYSASEAKALETIRMCEEKGAKTLLFRADVSDDDAVKRMLAAVDATFGRLDALANNAGITSEVGPKDFDAMTADEWDRVFAVNVRGLFQVTRASIPMLKAARGSIVNTASIVGLRPGLQPLPYAASKAAVVSLTKLFSDRIFASTRSRRVGWKAIGWNARSAIATTI
jgi:3-oxoacyl-[acyl-carrier protein] reductase